MLKSRVRLLDQALSCWVTEKLSQLEQYKQLAEDLQKLSTMLHEAFPHGHYSSQGNVEFQEEASAEFFAGITWALEIEVLKSGIQRISK